jgi:hypothetical protein
MQYQKQSERRPLLHKKIILEFWGTAYKSEWYGQVHLGISEPTQFAPKVPKKLVPSVPSVILS